MCISAIHISICKLEKGKGASNTLQHSRRDFAAAVMQYIVLLLLFSEPFFSRNCVAPKVSVIGKRASRGPFSVPSSDYTATVAEMIRR